MGFDRPGESGFEIPVSDTQAYKQFGNSVVVPMAVTVAEYMKPYVVSAMYDSAGTQQPLPLEIASDKKGATPRAVELA